MRACRQFIALLLTTPVLAGCGSLTSVDRGNNGEVSSSGLVFSLTESKSKPQSLGTFARAERREVPIRLENRTGRVLRWDTVRTSCECLEVRLPASQLDVDGRLDGVAVLDLEHTPDFRGGLILTAEAVTTGGSPVFTFELLADVN
jgi:hypothetical protein